MPRGSLLKTDDISIQIIECTSVIILRLPSPKMKFPFTDHSIINSGCHLTYRNKWPKTTSINSVRRPDHFQPYNSVLRQPSSLDRVTHRDISNIKNISN